jgi:hypothetical protein
MIASQKSVNRPWVTTQAMVLYRAKRSGLIQAAPSPTWTHQGVCLRRGSGKSYPQWGHTASVGPISPWHFGQKAIGRPQRDR